MNSLTRSGTKVGFRVANHKKFRGPPKVGRSPKLGDVSKGAASSKMATAKLGWVGDIDWAIAPNFGRCSKLLVVCHPGRDLKALNGMVHLIEDVIFPFAAIEEVEEESGPRSLSTC